MAHKTHNIARRFARLNDATKGSLLDLLERYELAAEAQRELGVVVEEIASLEALLVAGTCGSKRERDIEKRLTLLDAKEIVVKGRAEEREDAIRTALERLDRNIDSAMSNLLGY